MSLLVNQLTLSSVEIKNGRYQQAKTRLDNTKQIYPMSNIVQSNLSVSQCLANSQNSSNQEFQANNGNLNSQKISSSFEQSINLNPLNYISYYNLFNFQIKQGNISDGIKSLMEAITVLHLRITLRRKCQKTLSYGFKICSQSVLVHLIKAIIHIKNQKYVIAVSDLNWVLQRQLNIENKIQILSVIRLIFQALGQKQKQRQTEIQVNQLQQIPNNQLKQSKTSSQNSKRLICIYSIPQQKQQLYIELSKRLKQFSTLLKQIEVKSFKANSNCPKIIFKQINNSDLNHNQAQLNQINLIQTLKVSVLESKLYTKNEEKKLNKSMKSSDAQNNASQDLIFNPAQSQIIKRNQANTHSNKKQNRNTSMKMQSSEQDISSDNLQNSVDYGANKKLNHSLNSSGLRGKKKTQNIYPLQKQNQQVEIKLVMAQLTNNKQMMGSMDPYVVLTYNGKKNKSSVVKGGGLQPRWKQSYKFTLSQNPSQLLVEVFDQERFFKKDDFVGSGRQILQKNGFIKIPLFQQQKQAGIIFITIEAKS